MGFMRIDIENFFNKTKDEKSEYVDLVEKKIGKSIIDNTYSNICYPLLLIDNNEDSYKAGRAVKRVTWYRCALHQNIYSIHLSMLFQHILFSEPDKHKEFITNEMFPP